jgi:hypothetical protein
MKHSLWAPAPRAVLAFALSLSPTRDKPLSDRRSARPPHRVIYYG